MGTIKVTSWNVEHLDRLSGGNLSATKQKRRQRQRIFDVEDEIMAKRNELIEKLEKRVRQRTSMELLFTIRWSVV
jgi:CRISPR/Cas system type I-B associated protein Csh2 (Cas7 group RAMP superfamily)